MVDLGHSFSLVTCLFTLLKERKYTHENTILPCVCAHVYVHAPPISTSEPVDQLLVTVQNFHITSNKFNTESVHKFFREIKLYKSDKPVKQHMYASVGFMSPDQNSSLISEQTNHY